MILKTRKQRKRLPAFSTIGNLAIALDCHYDLERTLDSLFQISTDRLDITELEVAWNPRLGSVGGRANYRTGQVELHLGLFRNYQHELINTFLHEVAHFITHQLGKIIKISYAPHGEMWKTVAIMLGDDGGRCHSMHEIRTAADRLMVMPDGSVLETTKVELGADILAKLKGI